MAFSHKDAVTIYICAANVPNPPPCLSGVALPASMWRNTCVYNCPLSRLQPCHAVRPARQWTEVCSPQITPSAHGWPTSAAAATDSPPKSWRPQSASQTAPGATITRYLDASVRSGWGVERLQDKEEEGCRETGLAQEHKALLHTTGNVESWCQKLWN